MIDGLYLCAQSREVSAVPGRRKHERFCAMPTTVIESTNFRPRSSCSRGVRGKISTIFVLSMTDRRIIGAVQQ
jgi:hypothetical protein